MDNAEIRARILRFHYDSEMNRPGDFFNIDELPKLMPDVPQNTLDANILYLCRSRLIECHMVCGRTTPPIARISPIGIDVVENPDRYSGRFSLNVQVLNVGTNYGQLAQADRGSTVTQTETDSSFNDLRELVKTHSELTDADRERIDKVLANLEKTTNEGGLTKKIIEEARQALADYGWLIPPLITVLAKALGLG